MSPSDGQSAADRSAQYRIDSYDSDAYYGFDLDERRALVPSEYREIEDRPDRAQYAAHEGFEYYYHPHLDSEEGELSRDGEVMDEDFRGLQFEVIGGGDYYLWDEQRRNIEVYWQWVSNMSNEATNQHSTYWRRISSLLEVTSDTLRRRADALAGTWHGEASSAFLAEIGATLYSLDDWSRIASENAVRLAEMASQIERAQQDLGPLYNYYQATLAILAAWPTIRDQVPPTNGVPTELPIYDPQHVSWHSRTDAMPDPSEIMPAVTFNEQGDLVGDYSADVVRISSYFPEGRLEIQQLYHNRAAQVIQELADDYVNAHYYAFEPGLPFLGHTALNPSPGGQPPVRPSPGDLQAMFGVPAGLTGGGGLGGIPGFGGVPAVGTPSMALPPGAGLTPDALRAMAMPAGLAGLPGLTGVGTPFGLSPSQLAGLTPAQLGALSPAQLGGLTPAQLGALAPSQLAALSPSQLAGLTPAARAALTPSQLANLSPEQRAALARPPDAAALPPEVLAAQEQADALQQALNNPALAGALDAPAGLQTVAPQDVALPGAFAPGAGAADLAAPGVALPGSLAQYSPEAIAQAIGLGDVALPGATTPDGVAPVAGAGGAVPALPGATAGSAYPGGSMMPPPPPPMVPPMSPQGNQRNAQGGNGRAAGAMPGMPPPPMSPFVPPGRVTQQGRTPTTPQRIPPTLGGTANRPARDTGLNGVRGANGTAAAGQQSQRSQQSQEQSRAPEPDATATEQDRELWSVKKPKGLLRGAGPYQPAQHGKSIGAPG